MTGVWADFILLHWPGLSMNHKANLNAPDSLTGKLTEKYPPES
jgi:hypothetical protein